MKNDISIEKKYIYIYIYFKTKNLKYKKNRKKKFNQIKIELFFIKTIKKSINYELVYSKTSKYFQYFIYYF